MRYRYHRNKQVTVSPPHCSSTEPVGSPSPMSRLVVTANGGPETDLRDWGLADQFRIILLLDMAATCRKKKS